MMSTPLDQFSPELTIRAYASRYFSHPGDQLEIHKLAGDASTRQYYRVGLVNGQSYVISRYLEKVDPEEHPTCQITKLFLEARLPVPAILDVSELDGMMLLDDLGDLRVQVWFESASDSERRKVYCEAIDLIIQIQDTTSLAIEQNSIAARQVFDAEKLDWELRFFYENYIEKYLGRFNNPMQQEISNEFRTIAQRLASLPRVLCHRDYHSRNLMLKQGRLFIIDHQDARMGPVSYDLASLLGDPYVDLDDEFQTELFEYFMMARMKTGGSRFDPAWAAGFEQEYQLMLIQRLLKATGMYAYQMAVLGNDVYLPYIPRSTGRALEALRRLDRFPAIRTQLEEG